MAFLEIHNLSKNFGQNTVLHDINLTVPEGEFFVVLGPSGGGKSTLLRILCGIEKADTGTITLSGRDITHLPPRDRNIGMVFQDYGLYPHMNAWENIAYGLEARSMPRAIIEQRVKAAAEKLGITPILQRVIVDLSGGEQQRVALARALAKDAELYLFDEPLSNLDPKLRVQARRDILMVHREKRKPTLYVTHDQTEALASGDRIGIVARGRLQQIGTAEDLILRPANLFVAGFIGSPPMNILPVSLRRATEPDGYEAVLDGQTALRLPSHWNDVLQTYSKDRILLGLPPTAFQELSAGDQPASFTVLEGEIENLEALVGEISVDMKLASGIRLSALFQTFDDSAFVVGNRLRLSMDTERLCLFDPDTEQALA